MPWKVFIPLNISKTARSIRFIETKRSSQTLCVFGNHSWHRIVPSVIICSTLLLVTRSFARAHARLATPLANIRTLQRGIIRDHHPIIYVYVFIYLYRHMLATEWDEAHQRVVKCLIIRNMLPMSSYFLDHPGIRGIESLSWTSWTFWPGHQGYFQGSNAFSESWIEVASRNHHIGGHPKNDKALNLSEVL